MEDPNIGPANDPLLPTAVDRRRGVSFWITLTALMVLAAVPRLYHLGHPGLSKNEDYAAIAARAIREHGVPRFPSGAIYPRASVVSYVTAASTWLLGADEFAIRLPWALLSVPGVGLAYVFARRVFGRDVALLAALFLALSSWEIVTSRTARMYGPLSFAFLFALYSMHKVAFENDGRFRLPNLAATILTCSLHQLGAMLAVPYAIAFLLRDRVRRRGFVALAIAVVVLATVAEVGVQARLYAGFDQRVAARQVESDAAGAVLSFARAELPASRLVALAVLAGGVLLTIALRRPWPSRAAALATTAVLAGMQQLALAFYAAAASVGWLAFVRRRWSWLQAWSLAGALAVGSALWLGVLMTGPSRLSPERALRTIAGYPPNFMEFYARRSPAVFGVAILAVVVILVRFYRDRRSFAPHVVLVSAFALAATALGFHPRPRFNDRYVFHLDPYFAFLVAAGAWWLASLVAGRIARGEARAPRVRAVAIAVSMGLVLVTGGISPSRTVAAADRRYGENALLRDVGHGFVPDHVGGAKFVCSHASPGDFIVPMDILIHDAYCPGADIQLTMSDKPDAEGWIGVPSVDSLRAVAAQLERSEARRVWLLISGEAIHTYRDDPRYPGVMAFTGWDCARRVYTGRDGLSDVWMMDRDCFLRHALE
jgi:hypothetical protein